jgi:RimJ/RimL family protein N-acetyltransferase
MRTYLETERLELRELTADDLPSLAELHGDPAVMRYLTGGRPTPPEEIRDTILPRLLAWYDRGGDVGFWAAAARDTGEFLGWFELRPADGGPPDELELGYRLRRPAWGRGYATEGSRALVEKAFTGLGARRVTATTMTVNTGSRRVLEKAGLRYVRTFFADFGEVIEGSEHGDVEYALDRADWERRHGAD